MGCVFSDPNPYESDGGAAGQNGPRAERLTIIRGGDRSRLGASGQLDGQDADLLADAKVVLLGASGVGKSSLAMRFCQGRFSGCHEVTIGAAFLQRTVQLQNGGSLKLHIWDTGGQERFRAMAPLYYRGAAGALIVWDCTQSDTFGCVKYWCSELRTKGPPACCIAAVGNKADAVQLAREKLAAATSTAAAAAARGDGNTASADPTSQAVLMSGDTDGRDTDGRSTATTTATDDAESDGVDMSDSDSIARRYQAMQECKGFCDAENILFVECSAKTGYNVTRVFDELAAMIYEQRREQSIASSSGSVPFPSGSAAIR